MARKYGSVDSARRRTATRKSSRKPGGGRTKRKFSESPLKVLQVTLVTLRSWRYCA